MMEIDPQSTQILLHANPPECPLGPSESTVCFQNRHICRSGSRKARLLYYITPIPAFSRAFSPAQRVMLVAHLWFNRNATVHRKTRLTGK